MSFQEGFCFLGEDFGPRYPPSLDLHRVEEPDRRIVYVGLQGSRIRAEAGRLLVESQDDVEVLDVPQGLVERVVCFGAVGFSAGARSWASRQSVDVVFVSRRGSYEGQLVGKVHADRAARLRAQVVAGDNLQRRLAFGRAVVKAKVSKQIVHLQRMTRRSHADQVADAIRSLRRDMAMIPECVAIEELMDSKAPRQEATSRGWASACRMTFASTVAAGSRRWTSSTPPWDTAMRCYSANACPRCTPRGWTRHSGCCTLISLGVPRWPWT